MTFALEPVTTRYWATRVAAVVESVSALPRRDRTPFQTLPLAANRGRGRLVVSLDRDAPPATPFAFMVGDTLSATGWTVNASSADLRRLLTAIEKVAGGSALDSAAGDVRPTPFLECELDEPPRLSAQHRLQYPLSARNERKEGRVLLSFVIDSAGAVPVDSLRVVWSDRKAFDEAVRHWLSRAAYTPGRRAGRPVNTRVWEWFIFRMRQP